MHHVDPRDRQSTPRLAHFACARWLRVSERAHVAGVHLVPRGGGSLVSMVMRERARVAGVHFAPRGGGSLVAMSMRRHGRVLVLQADSIQPHTHDTRHVKDWGV